MAINHTFLKHKITINNYLNSHYNPKPKIKKYYENLISLNSIN
jgi:hypothetical protein